MLLLSLTGCDSGLWSFCPTFLQATQSDLLSCDILIPSQRSITDETYTKNCGPAEEWGKISHLSYNSHEVVW